MLMEECGVFGTYLKEGNIAPSYVVEGLMALQHRGQEAAGVSYTKGEKIESFKELGTVGAIFNKKTLSNMKGKISIGHVRYSTKGTPDITGAQPFTANYANSSFSIAHNGQIEYSEKLKNELEKKGIIFLTDSDTEIVLHLLVSKLRKSPDKWTLEEISKIIFENIGPSYSLIIMFKNRMIAIRDKKGYRPLSFYEDEHGYYFSSEDCGLRFLSPNMKKIRDVKPGEAIEITEKGVKNVQYETQKYSHCFFEHVYFSRPDSNVFGRNAHQMRERMGEQCAIENPVDADIVVPVMESGLSAAMGYSKMSGIPVEMGLIRNRYIGRTFIHPEQTERKIGVKRKLTPIYEVIKNKRIILVDDSIVRGTTMTEIVDLLRQYRAREVHVRISSPAVVSTCSWGVNIPDKKELIANKKNVKQIEKHINADSLGYLSLKGVRKILNFDHENYCLHCFIKNNLEE